MEIAQNSPEKEKFKGITRPLKEEDLPFVKEVLEMWLRSMFTREIIPEEVEADMGFLKGSLNGSNERKYWVAQTEDGKVIGVMGLTKPKEELMPFKQTERPIELVNAYVDKDYRKGRGVGTALLNTLQNFARESGYTEILLESGPRYGKTGHPFYDKREFTRVGILENFYGRGFHSQVFRKPL